MKLTKPKTVKDIIQPATVGIRSQPSVGLFDTISRVVVIMLQHDLQNIAVMQYGRIIGCVSLSEALNELGLRPDKKKKATFHRIKDG